MNPPTEEPIELPERPDLTRATILLINDHYRKLGCHSWDTRRFRRLAAAARWTERELGARVGLDSQELKYWIKRNLFPLSVGILLTQFERYFRLTLTGYDDGQDLFNPCPSISKSSPKPA